MSFVSTGGGGKWSQITIDVDKDMLGHGLSNVKEVVAAMIGGDLIAKGLGGVLVRIPAGIANTVLTSAGIGQVPTWAPGGLYLNRYFPVIISLGAPVVTKNTVPTHQKAFASNPVTSVYVNDVGDDVAHYLKLLTPAITLPSSQAKNTVPTHASPALSMVGKTPSHYDLQTGVFGAVRDFGGAQTTETAAAQNATANDMTLSRAAAAVGDAYYYAFESLWDALVINIGTNGSATWVWTWEYWNGAWVSLAGVTDGTTGYTSGTGLKTVSWTRPGDWATTTVNGVGPYYWVRSRISNFTAIVTVPLGTQAWGFKKI